MSNLRHFFDFIRDGQFRRALGMIYDYAIWGCTECEVWSLDTTLARYILPRLCYFRWDGLHGPAFGVPMGLTTEEWETILEDMIFSLECCAQDTNVYTKEQEDKINHGLELFGKYFRALWN